MERDKRFKNMKLTIEISTHALTWSATGSGNDNICLYCHFNSRAHVECDARERRARKMSEISTHALTWSATWTMRAPW